MWQNFSNDIALFDQGESTQERRGCPPTHRPQRRVWSPSSALCWPAAPCRVGLLGFPGLGALPGAAGSAIPASGNC